MLLFIHECTVYWMMHSISCKCILKNFQAQRPPTLLMPLKCNETMQHYSNAFCSCLAYLKQFGFFCTIKVSIGYCMVKFTWIKILGSHKQKIGDKFMNISIYKNLYQLSINIDLCHCHAIYLIIRLIANCSKSW